MVNVVPRLVIGLHLAIVFKICNPALNAVTSLIVFRF